MQCPTRESGGRRGGNSTAGELRDEVKSSRAGFLAAESILVLGMALPFAGWRWSGGLGRFERAIGGSTPSEDSGSTTTGCSGSSRGGAPLFTVSRGVACAMKGGPSLGVSRLTASFVTVSTSRCRKRRLGRRVARKAARRMSGDLRGSSYGARLQRQVASSVGLEVTHLPAAFGRRRLT